jgi:hypothetical protein
MWVIDIDEWNTALIIHATKHYQSQERQQQQQNRRKKTKQPALPYRHCFLCFKSKLRFSDDLKLETIR